MSNALCEIDARFPRRMLRKHSTAPVIVSAMTCCAGKLREIVIPILATHHSWFNFAAGLADTTTAVPQTQLQYNTGTG